MADAVSEFFATLPDRLDHSRTTGMRNTYVFDVEGTANRGEQFGRRFLLPALNLGQIPETHPRTGRNLT